MEAINRILIISRFDSRDNNPDIIHRKEGDLR